MEVCYISISNTVYALYWCILLLYFPLSPRVIESKNPQWKVGSYLMCYTGWRSHTHIPAEELKKVGFMYSPLPDLSGMSKTLGLGVIGMPG